MELKIGKKVKVLSVTDEAASERYIGCVGKIVKIDTDPDIPEATFVHLRFRKSHTNGFWADELGPNTACTGQKPARINLGDYLTRRRVRHLIAMSAKHGFRR